MTASTVSGLTCMRCARHFRRGLDGPCPRCGPEGVLDIEFDLKQVRRTLTRRALASRPQDMWRYRELLPVPERARRAPAPVGWTPITLAPRLADWAGLHTLLVKDEGRNPTASFKDRASAVGVARAAARARASWPARPPATPPPRWRAPPPLSACAR
jgi:threonine synthase